ncbi:MAG: MFS transporter [Planctomycetes bacterium]|nr:MFS transporter [Planctomycetota bacterium]MCC7397195.1 MFS transporter [Planctomycetota bacterium]
MHEAHRNFRAVWPSLFATAMGLMAFLPVLPLYVKERFGFDDGDSLTCWASLIYGAAPFAAACAGPFWGALGDRVGKKPMAIRANLAIAATTALMPLAPTPMWLLVMRALQGLLAGYVAPAMALAAQSVPRESHGRVIARLQVAMATGTFLGPQIGAEVSHWFGRESLFFVASGLSLCAALWLRLGAVETAAPPRHARFTVEFAAAARTLFAGRVFPALLLLVFVFRIGQNMLEPLLALFVRQLGAEPWLLQCSETPTLALDRTIAAAFGVLAVAQWFCTPMWGRLADRHGPLRCLALASLAIALLQLGMVLVETTRQFLLLRCVTACFMAGSMTLAYAAVSKRVPDQHRTFAFALVQSCIQFGLAVGPVLGALVAASDGAEPELRRAFFASACLCALAGLGMIRLRRRSTASTT